MENGKIGFGMIGLGLISQAHELGYQEESRRISITAICDINPEIAKQRAKNTGAKVYTDYRELISDAGIDAVDITLPHILHYPVARFALEHKKHVIMEKPFVLNWREGQELINLAKEKGVTFTIAENTRFVKAYIEAEKIIKTGILGEARQIRTFISGSEVGRLVNTTNWKGRKDGSGGGAIIDAGAHSFYLLKWFLGELETVQAVEYKYIKESQVEDYGMVVGRAKEGAIFSSEFSFIIEAPWNERMEFHGSKGSLIIDQLVNPVGIYYQGGEDFKGTALVDVTYDPQYWKVRSIADGVKDFVDALWNQRPPMVDPADANYAIKVIQKAYESIPAGKPLRVE